ncbi:MAG: hypothetical protein Alpg2KO_03320 [Alphaproteobacteria bacterium]
MANRLSSRLSSFFTKLPKFSFMAGSTDANGQGAATPAAKARPGIFARGLRTLGGISAFALRWMAIFIVASSLYSTYQVQTFPDQDRYSRSAELYQQDLEGVSDVIRMVQTDPQVKDLRANWDDMTDEARMQGLVRIQQRFVENYPGYEAVGVDTFRQAPFLCLSSGICAIGGGVEIRYQQVDVNGQKRFMIDTSYRSPANFNTHWISNWDDFEDTLDVLIHETTHALQLQMLDKAVNGDKDLSVADVKAFTQAANSYVAPGQSLVRYYTNALEEHAFSNGNCVQRALEILEDEERMSGMTLRQPVKAVLGACFDNHRAGKSLRVSDADILSKDRELQRKAAPTADANPTPLRHQGF